MAERHEDPSQQLTARRYEADKRDLATKRDAEDKRERELSRLVAEQAQEMAEDKDRVWTVEESRHIPDLNPNYM